nr:uncharacterized protein LOC113807519 [Penaeus vannamei]
MQSRHQLEAQGCPVRYPQVLQLVAVAQVIALVQQCYRLIELASAHPVQPSKPSVPGTVLQQVMSGLSGAVPPGVTTASAASIIHQQQTATSAPASTATSAAATASTADDGSAFPICFPTSCCSSAGCSPTCLLHRPSAACYVILWKTSNYYTTTLPHMAPTSLATGRDGNMTSAAYSAADAKFRTDQNSSPVPSTMNQQGAQAGVHTSQQLAMQQCPVLHVP